MNSWLWRAERAKVLGLDELLPEDERRKWQTEKLLVRVAYAAASLSLTNTLLGAILAVLLFEAMR